MNECNLTIGQFVAGEQRFFTSTIVAALDQRNVRTALYAIRGWRELAAWQSHLRSSFTVCAVRREYRVRASVAFGRTLEGLVLASAAAVSGARARVGQKPTVMTVCSLGFLARTAS
jgi:hypothetical protein